MKLSDVEAPISSSLLEDSGLVLSLTRPAPFGNRNIPGTHFCQRLDGHRNHSAVGRIGSSEHSSDFVGSGIRGLPACSSAQRPKT
jgi:hypothetical protein